MSYIKPNFSLDYRVIVKSASPSYVGKTDVVDGYLQIINLEGRPTLEKFKMLDDALILATYEMGSGANKEPYIIYIDTSGDIKTASHIQPPYTPIPQKQPK